MDNNSPSRLRGNANSLIQFFVLVFLISAPFWFLAAVSGQALPEETSINLPISSLMAICPIIAGLILVRKKRGARGVKNLLNRSFDYQKIEKKIWYVPILFLLPGIAVLASRFENRIPAAVTAPPYPILMVLGSSILFFIAALTEEVGWSGYAVDRMQDRYGALTASLILGSVWAVWHIIPFIQTQNSANWIIWQSMSLVVTRILIVWVYNNTGQSVFATILFHAMYNVGTLVLPNFGFVYDPVVTTIILTSVALVAIFLWGPKSLANYRFPRFVGAA